MCERISKRVPDERRLEAPLEIVGPTLEKMQYVREGSELWDMFEEVLTKSVDSATQKDIHPSFCHLISMLGRDEAWILYRLREKSFAVVDYLVFDQAENKFKDRVVEMSELPRDELYLPDLIELSYSHLGPVMAALGEAADPRAIPAHHQPVAVMLDFVIPERTGRRSEHLRRQARLNEAGGSLHDHGRCIVMLLPRHPLCRARA